MNAMNLTSLSAKDTTEIGQSIGKVAKPGDIVLLAGELGAGKTCLTQGIAKGLEVEERVHSPTFVLVSEYTGRLDLFHMDLYRLDTLSDVLDLGLEEYFFGEGVSVVEWADKIPEAFPGSHLFISIRYNEDDSRELHLKAYGDRYKLLVQDLRQPLRKFK
jgi:tRNA threonylcarbamoyladenosine biosynthesis protein TsaE